MRVWVNVFAKGGGGRNDPAVIGRKVGIKFQQIQKYETGMNMVSASRLRDMVEVMDVLLSFFFVGLKSRGPDKSVDNDLLGDKEALALVRFYYALS